MALLRSIATIGGLTSVSRLFGFVRDILIASALSRSLRFFVVAGIIGLLYRRHGERIKEFIDRYFNALAIAFVILLILGFMALKYVKGD